MILTFNCGFGNLLSQSENFKLFGFIYLVFPKSLNFFGPGYWKESARGSLPKNPEPWCRHGNLEVRRALTTGLFMHHVLLCDPRLQDILERAGDLVSRLEVEL